MGNAGDVQRLRKNISVDLPLEQLSELVDVDVGGRENDFLRLASCSSVVIVVGQYVDFGWRASGCAAGTRPSCRRASQAAGPRRCAAEAGGIPAAPPRPADPAAPPRPARPADPAASP